MPHNDINLFLSQTITDYGPKCFVHSIFRSWFLVTFGNQVTKVLRNLCLHFAWQDGQDGKKLERNHATKVTKIPKTKRRKYGIKETIVQLRNEYCQRILWVIEGTQQLLMNYYAFKSLILNDQ